MFGSDFVHANWIAVEISEAELNRRHNEDKINGRKVLMRFEMSESQWARFISSHSDHQGTPITLRRMRDSTGKMVMLPAFPRRVETNEFPGETADHIASVGRSLATLETLLTQDLGKLSKADRERALEHVRTARREIGPNLGFIADQMTEHLERKVTDAKSEVDAWIQNTIARAGLEALAGSPIVKGPSLLAAPDERGDENSLTE